MIPKSWSHTFVTKGGIKCTAVIGPYVWMYHQGKVDAIIVEDEKGCELRPKCNFDMATSTPEELVKFVESYAYPESDCKVCGYHMLAHASHYRTNDECDECCKNRLTEEFKVENDKELVKEAIKEKKLYAQGFRWKAEIWVHAGGDDECLVLYRSVKPTTKEIHAILKKEGSRVMDDFTITELKVT